MNSTDFYQVVTERCDKIKRTLVSKGKEYSTDDNKLHNFDRGAQIEGKTRERVLHGMMLKHFISYLDILDKIDKGEIPSNLLIDEKVGDIINYFILFEAMVKDRNSKLQALPELNEAVINNSQ